ncbi:MAG: DUF805 domain-containing protein [Pseudomonadota bacterium]
MGFVEATKTCVRKTFVYSGRASRSEFWWFYLALVLLSIAFGLIDLAMGWSAQGWRMSVILGLPLLFPWMSACYRRLHDSGRPGYLALPLFAVSFGFVLLELVPERFWVGSTTILGGIYLGSFLLTLYWMTRPSQTGANQYGHEKDPRYYREVFE